MDSEINKYKRYAMTGMIGSVICAIADIFLDLKGPDNQTLGFYQVINSNWMDMAGWRFGLSILIAAVAVPMYGLGLIALKAQLDQISVKTGKAFAFFAYPGLLGGLFIHASLCLLPVIYQQIMPDFDLAERTINAIYEAVMVPFYSLYCFLVVMPSLLVMTTIIRGGMKVSKWFVLCNPLVFMLIGIAFRFISPIFSDVPGIFMPTLGLGAMGMTAWFSIASQEKLMRN